MQTRLTRVDNAIERLTDYVDDGDTAGVDRTGKVIRRQLAAAWRGAKYYVANAAAARPRRRRSPPTTRPLIADPATAAFAVFESYHAVAATIGQLVDGARVPVLNSMSKTLYWTLDSRDKAIAAARTFESARRSRGRGARGRGGHVRDRDAGHDRRTSTTRSSSSRACRPTPPTCARAAHGSCASRSRRRS